MMRSIAGMMIVVLALSAGVSCKKTIEPAFPPGPTPTPTATPTPNSNIQIHAVYPCKYRIDYSVNDSAVVNTVENESVTLSLSTPDFQLDSGDVVYITATAGTISGGAIKYLDLRIDGSVEKEWSMTDITVTFVVSYAVP